MGYSTVYDVRVRYGVDNRAGRAVDGLVKDTRQLGNEVKRTTGLFGKLGTAVVGAFGVRMAGKALIGFNSTVEDTKNQIAGMLSLTRKTDLVDQLKHADRLFGNLQKRANTLPGTTMEYARMAGMLTQPIINAGLTMKDLEDLTVSAVVGAKALGVEWEVAARDIDQAIRGQFKSVDVFTGKMLGSIGYTGEEGRAKFNSLDKDKRASELQRAMNQKQIQQLAAAQGATFSGALSTLQDTAQQFFGKVGKPLFGKITAELKDWNKWINANGDRLEDIARTVGDKLVDGFSFIKDVMGFLVSHSDTLIMIGKAWATVKIGSMLGGGLGGLVGSGASGAGGLADFFRRQSDGFNKDTGEYEHRKAGRGHQGIGGMKGLADNLGLLASSAAAGYAIGNLLGLDKVGESIGSSMALLTGKTNSAALQIEKMDREMAHLAESTRKAAAANPTGPSAIVNRQGMAGDYAQRANLVADVMAAQKRLENDTTIENMNRVRQAMDNARAAGIGVGDIAGAGGMGGYVTSMQAKATNLTNQTAGIGAVGSLTMITGIAQLTEYQRKTLDVQVAQHEVMAYLTQTLTKPGGIIDPAVVMDLLRKSTADPSGTHKTIADKAKVNVTIQRIEVQSDDPDRMAFGLIESFRDAAKNPSSALSALREG